MQRKGPIPPGGGDECWRGRCHSSRDEVSVCPQIMHAFSVAPFDQNLSLDGKILSDDTATLGSLGVIPESVILLKVLVGWDSGMPRDWCKPREACWAVCGNGDKWNELLLELLGGEESLIFFCFGKENP